MLATFRSCEILICTEVLLSDNLGRSVLDHPCGLIYHCNLMFRAVQVFNPFVVLLLHLFLFTTVSRFSRSFACLSSLLFVFTLPSPPLLSSVHSFRCYLLPQPFGLIVTNSYPMPHYFDVLNGDLRFDRFPVCKLPSLTLLSSSKPYARSFFRNLSYLCSASLSLIKDGGSF